MSGLKVNENAPNPFSGWFVKANCGYRNNSVINMITRQMKFVELILEDTETCNLKIISVKFHVYNNNEHASTVS